MKSIWKIGDLSKKTAMSESNYSRRKLRRANDRGRAMTKKSTLEDVKKRNKVLSGQIAWVKQKLETANDDNKATLELSERRRKALVDVVMNHDDILINHDLIKVGE